MAAACSRMPSIPLKTLQRPIPVMGLSITRASHIKKRSKISQLEGDGQILNAFDIFNRCDEPIKLIYHHQLKEQLPLVLISLFWAYIIRSVPKAAISLRLTSFLFNRMCITE